ncbi:MAG TPA: RDD family protein [Candidatus Eisenbacteria bacterium]|nr:RDD family protein [Candidatus Eisenbacteria bacterium]
MWPRAAAYLIDLLILAVLSGVIAGLVAAVAPTTAARLEPGGTGIQSGTPISALVSVAVSFVYFFFLWRSSGRGSVGQRLLGIQVGNAFDGAILTPGQATIRWAALGYPLSLLSVTQAGAAAGGLLNFMLVIALFLTTLGSPTRQGWHDKLAGSAVVRRAGASNRGVVVVVAIVAILLLVVLVALVGLTFLGAQMSEVLSQTGADPYPSP